MFEAILQKSQLILEYEKRFTRVLSIKVLDKPQLHIWMIFIPIIFSHYFLEWKKYKNCSISFNQQYICNFQLALDEAVAVVQDGREPDFDSLLTKTPGIPAEAQEKLADLFSVLIEHYEALLRATGNNYRSLVQSVYIKRANYLLFVNRLNNVEKKFNAALKPHLDESIEDANDIICAIERYSETIRRNDAEEIFAYCS
jgi:hypothetical protein